MRLRYKTFFSAACLTFLASSLAQPALAENDLYGKGNGVSITAQEAEVFKNRMVPKEVIPPKREMLRVMLQQRLFAKEAETQILPKDKDLAVELELLKENRLAKAFADDYLQKNLKIDDAVLESYYLSHIEDFKTPKQFDLSRLIFDNQEKAQAAVQQLQQRPDAFSDLVKTSMDPVFRQKEGKMGLIKETDLRPEIKNALSDIKENGIAGPVEINGFYYVFRVNKIVPESHRSFADVKNDKSLYDKIAGAKKDEVLRKYAEELAKKYGFEWTELAKEGWDSPIAPISGN